MMTFLMIMILYFHRFHLFSEGTAVNCDKFGDGNRFNKMTEGGEEGGLGGGGSKVDDNWPSGPNVTKISKLTTLSHNFFAATSSIFISTPL